MFSMHVIYICVWAPVQRGVCVMFRQASIWRPGIDGGNHIQSVFHIIH